MADSKFVSVTWGQARVRQGGREPVPALHKGRMCSVRFRFKRDCCSSLPPILMTSNGTAAAVWPSCSCFHMVLASYLDVEAFVTTILLCRRAFSIRRFCEVPEVYCWVSNAASLPLSRADWNPFRLDIFAREGMTFNMCRKDYVFWYIPVVYHIPLSSKWFCHALDFDWLVDADTDSLGVNVSFDVLESAGDLLNVIDRLVRYQFEVDREEKDITVNFAEYGCVEESAKAVVDLLEDLFERLDNIDAGPPPTNDVTVKISFNKETFWEFHFDSRLGEAAWGPCYDGLHYFGDNTFVDEFQEGC